MHKLVFQDFIEVAESEKEGYEKNVPELELSETNSSSFEVEPSSDILLTKAAEDKVSILPFAISQLYGDCWFSFRSEHVLDDLRVECPGTSFFLSN